MKFLIILVLLSPLVVMLLGKLNKTLGLDDRTTTLKAVMNEVNRGMPTSLLRQALFIMRVPAVKAVSVSLFALVILLGGANTLSPLLSIPIMITSVVGLWNIIGENRTKEKNPRLLDALKMVEQLIDKSRCFIGVDATSKKIVNTYERMAIHIANNPAKLYLVENFIHETVPYFESVLVKHMQQHQLEEDYDVVTTKLLQKVEHCYNKVRESEAIDLEVELESLKKKL